MAVKAERSFSLADQLFNATTVGTLAEALASAYPKFKTKPFKQACQRAFPELELKDRIRYMVERLNEQLPDNFDQALALLEAALPPPLDPNLSDDDFGHFIWSVPAEWVALHGCTEQRLKPALAFLRQATMRFSAENAIRPFLNAYPETTLAFVQRCAVDDNYHVRRLASEGIRPYLPWAQQVKLPADQVIEVLNLLHADATRYVTRSVANTLNDLSRTEPELVINTLETWHQAGKQQQAELDWMTRHALRTLVKSDNPQALAMLGYPTQPEFSLRNVTLEAAVAIGDSLHWRGTLKSLTKQKLKIALRLHFLKANGKHSVKVFAVKDISADQETITIEKNISFKPITTRTLYPGTHHIELVVNGKLRGKRAFELTES